MTLVAKSNQPFKNDQWGYAGPLEGNKQCGGSKFGDLPADLKSQADVTRSNNDRTARVQIPVARSDGGLLYCFQVEGYTISRRVDFTPPIITLGEEANRIKAQDAFTGVYGPPGVVNADTWQAAPFDIAVADDYGCDENNEQLVFKAVKADGRFFGKVFHGNTNTLFYYAPPRYVDAIGEFFNGLQNTVYAQPETDPTKIPVIDGELNELFTDNVHLCHRVSDHQGNTSYKLMRLDLGAPVIKFALDKSTKTIRASSPAVDLDDTSWQYSKITERFRTYGCEQLDRLHEPTGYTSVVSGVKNGHWYCFSVLDKRGVGRARLIRIDWQKVKNTPPADDQPVTTTTDQSTSDSSSTDDQSVLVPSSADRRNANATGADDISVSPLEPRPPKEEPISAGEPGEEIAVNNQPTESVAVSQPISSNVVRTPLETVAQSDDANLTVYIIWASIISGVILLVMIVLFIGAPRRKKTF